MTGGIIKGVGEVTGSDFIKEVGDGVKHSTEFAGKRLGSLAEGAWNVGSGLDWLTRTIPKLKRDFLI